MRLEDFKTRKVLLKIGISSNVKGYQFILDAIHILKRQNIHKNIDDIYEYIYKRNGKVSRSYIERAIRTAIETAYRRRHSISQNI